VQNYGPRTISLYSITLWDAIKFEILQAQEEDLAQESLKLLAAIAFTLSSGNKDALLTYLKPVIKECNEHLEDAPTKQSEAASRILSAISCASWEACNTIITGVIPHLLVLHQSTQDIPKRRSLIQTLARLIEAGCYVFGDWTISPYQQHMKDETKTGRFGMASESALHSFSKQVLANLTTALASVRISDVSYRLALLDSLQQLAKAREILNDDEITQVIKLLNDVILVEEPYGKDEARSAATIALDEIAKQKPQIVIDQSFPAFLSKLPDNDVDYDGQYIPVLEAFARLGVGDKIFTTAVVRLKNKLNSAIHSGASSHYIQAILSAILYIVTNTTTSLQGTDDTFPFYNDLLIPLLRTVPAALKDHQQEDIVYGLTGRICNELLRRQSFTFQSKVISSLFSPTGENSSEDGLPGVQWSKETGRQVFISVYLLAAIRRDVPLPYGPTLWLMRLIEMTQSYKFSPGTLAAATQQVSLLVNKFLSISELKSVLSPKVEELLRDAASLPVVFGILKALVLRNAPILNSVFPALVQKLADERVRSSVAHGFSTLLQPDEILTKQNHCIISPLYKQKTFAMLVPDIIQAVRTTGVEEKKNYLIALSGILRWLPFAVIDSEVLALTALLLQTLDIDGEDDIKVGAIDMLTLILQERSQVLEEHFSSVITRLLSITSSYQNPPRVREKALQCLTLLPIKLRTEVVIPYRKQVIKKLTVAVDDRRRAVRAEAVRCRTKWIEMDDVGSADQDDD
jgi:DNA repair/transcription protein MET18/MMS19